jgi:hypothetical protein
METVVDRVTDAVTEQEHRQDPQAKAARIRAGLVQFARLRVSSEQFMREKQTERQQELGDAGP